MNIITLPTAWTPAELLRLVESLDRRDLVSLPLDRETALRLLRLAARTGQDWESIGREAAANGLPLLELLAG